MNLRRGDIHWIDFPTSSARERAGRRPAIIVHSEATPPFPIVFVVPLTANPRAKRFPGTFEVQPSAGNGLDLPSVVLAFQLRAIDRTRVGERIGTLEPVDLRTLEVHLRALLAL